MALTSVSRAKQSPALASVSSTYLSNLLEAASDAIENYLDTKVAQATTTTEKQYGTGLQYFFTKNIPVSTFTQVIVDDGTGSTYTLDTDDVEVDTSIGKVWIKYNASSSLGLFPAVGFPNLTVSYTYGYSTVPDAIQEACVQLCAGMYSQTSAANPHLSAFKMGEYSETRGGASGGAGAISTAPGGITGPVALLLEPYRRLVQW